MAQRAHGGAALQHIPLAAPGFQGLNTENSSSILGPEWATELTNCVIDDANRLAARKGWSDQTTTPNGAAFVSGVEFQKASGAVELILTTDTTVVRSTDEGVSFSAVTGTASFTDGNWHFVNFADRVVGVQSGKQPIVYSGSTFSHISDAGNEPTGGAATAFAGRMWIVDSDGHTLKYSALLDETDWSSADSGSWDFQNVWKGTDSIQALVPHNGALVVFGRRNILFLTDGAGSTLGLDPTQAYVADIISGVGCTAQESVQNVDGDLWFISETGLMSLGRLIQERSNPMQNLSLNVQSALLADLNFSSFDSTDLRSAYSPKDRFYLLSLPMASGSNEVGRTWVFDTRGRLQDGSARCLGHWTGLVPQVLIKRSNLDIFASNRANTGELFKYSTQADDTASYTMKYRSGWTDLGATGIKKILKRMAGVFFSSAATTVNYKWAWDFEDIFSTRTQVFEGADDGSLWDIGLWGTAKWAGGVSLREGKVIPSGTGKYIKFGVDVAINGNEFSLQQLELYAKLGRQG
jgi:hypothetical protein